MTSRPAYTIKLKNTKKFLAGFKELGKATAEGALLRALRRAEYQAIAYTKLNINRHKLIKTGAMINSVMEDHVDTTKRNARVFFGPHVVYAAIHEFGGTIHSTSGKGLIFQIDGRWIRKQFVRLPARPYLRPVFDEHELELLDIIEKTLYWEQKKAFYG
jgi:phage gpG-like protein